MRRASAARRVALRAGVRRLRRGRREPAAAQTSTNASGAIELTVLYDDGSGRKTTGTLTCRGADRSAAGAFEAAPPRSELCAQARGIAELLTSEPEAGRTCTQIYGGPETAAVTGTIDGEQVDRRSAHERLRARRLQARRRTAAAVASPLQTAPAVTSAPRAAGAPVRRRRARRRGSASSPRAACRTRGSGARAAPNHCADA